ncbi:hypothetical protein GIB67_029700 [Kingdonia uniflora]|uniref:Uncharacterized protein n=1 Tax=Kingdonia uniflora TaxID=39325 RepID=A0A7J7LLH7_9MAGN|nr:hypothetical protein GIB67_029700 [Kingdonia uniflora]
MTSYDYDGNLNIVTRKRSIGQLSYVRELYFLLIQLEAMNRLTYFLLRGVTVTAQPGTASTVPKAQRNGLYQVGLKGKAVNIASPDGTTPVEWMQTSLVAQKQQPLTWYKAYINAPHGHEPLTLC